MKVRIIISALIVGVILAAIGGIFFLSQNQTNADKKLLPSITTPTPELLPSSTLKEYIDTSGFSFEYPDNFEVNKTETTNTTVYSDLVISTPDNENGSILIKVTDTKARNIDGWIVQEKISTATATITDATLGELPAKRIKTTEKTQIIAIDQGILFLVELLANDDMKYFEKAYSTITSTFKFVSTAPTVPAGGSSTSGSTGEDILLEEEIIE